MTKPEPRAGCPLRRTEPPTRQEVERSHRNIRGFVMDGDALAEVAPPMDVVAEMLYAAAQVAIHNGVCASCFASLFCSVMRETAGRSVNVSVSIVGRDDGDRSDQASLDREDTVH